LQQLEISKIAFGRTTRNLAWELFSIMLQVISSKEILWMIKWMAMEHFMNHQPKNFMLVSSKMDLSMVMVS
jgi:hypothetical protein